MRRTRTLPSIWPLLLLLVVVIATGSGLATLLITGAGR